MKNKFTPMIFPKKSEDLDIEEVFDNIDDWIFYDDIGGIRVEIFSNGITNVGLDLIPNYYINRMAEDFRLLTQHDGCIEAQLYSPSMTKEELEIFMNSTEVAPRDYPKDLKFYVFDHYLLDDKRSKLDRYLDLVDLFHTRIDTEENKDLELDAILIHHFSSNFVDNIYQAYDQAIIDGYKGLKIIKKDSMYMKGRIKPFMNIAYKL